MMKCIRIIPRFFRKFPNHRLLECFSFINQSCGIFEYITTERNAKLPIDEKIPVPRHGKSCNNRAHVISCDYFVLTNFPISSCIWADFLRDEFPRVLSFIWSADSYLIIWRHIQKGYYRYKLCSLIYSSTHGQSPI